MAAPEHPAPLPSRTASRTPWRGTGPHRSVATVCLSGTLADKLTAAASSGFDGVEIFENDLIASSLSPEDVRHRSADLGLTIDLYQPFRDFEAVPPELFEANLRRATHKFGVMRRLGADTMLVCSSVSPAASDDDGLAAAQLRALAERAAERGIRVAYEALAWGRFVNTWEHSWDLVRRADHPSLGLCLDSFHVLSRVPDAPGIADLPGDKLFFLQLADAPRMDMDVLQWSRHHRLFPGQGAFELPTFLGHVLAAGYRGPLSLEVFNDVFRQADPARTAVDAMRSLLALEEALDQHTAEAASTRIELYRPPRAAELRGHAFTELTVDTRSGPRVAAALTALGFTHSGDHRTKPVQLWQQGAARVLLNAGVRDTDAVGVAAISALAVETTDPARAARRAEALISPVLPRSRGPAEADLAAIAAPDGTSVFFCRTGADDASSWLSDFIPISGASSSGAGLTNTDHVALAQPFDHFDEATLFYRSVLNLEPQHDDEYAAPFGLAHTRALTDRLGRVRIALTGTTLRRGDWTPGVPDPQHLAFTTEDIFASAQAMRERGAPLLAISDNYYEDLDARLALDPDLLSAMRSAGVLYDRDEFGEFLHLYTEVLGSRVFFEVVQRIDDYAGYGAVNAPIRMAAHRRRRLARPV